MVKTFLFFILVLISSLPSCTSFKEGVVSRPERGKVYIVKRRDTLSKIADRVHLSYQEIAEANHIEDPAKISVGDRLYIPERKGDRGGSEPNEPEKPREEKKPKKGKEGNGAKAGKNHFIWPITGEVSSLFGPRSGGHHDGIDILAKEGTKIVAAEDGEVVFSGKLGGYGNLVVVRHKSDYFTAYGHNSVNSVSKGKKVKRGKTQIGKVGSTGNATTSHLHFEVRYKESSKDPLIYLPKSQGSH